MHERTSRYALRAGLALWVASLILMPFSGGAQTTTPPTSTTTPPSTSTTTPPTTPPPTSTTTPPTTGTTTPPAPTPTPTPTPTPPTMGTTTISLDAIAAEVLSIQQSVAMAATSTPEARAAVIASAVSRLAVVRDNLLNAWRLDFTNRALNALNTIRAELSSINASTPETTRNDIINRSATTIASLQAEYLRLLAATGGGGGVSSSGVTLSIGSRSAAVSALQTALGVVSTGYYGPLTEAAVRQFQTARGLSVTGMVDGSTWSALGAAYPSLANVSFTDTSGKG